MEETENKGSFDVINSIGKAKAKPKKEAKQKLPVDLTDDAQLAELQQRYLWECTFEVL